jgi:hypothetical protein
VRVAAMLLETLAICPHLRSTIAGRTAKVSRVTALRLISQGGRPGDRVELDARAERPDDSQVVDQHLDRTLLVVDRVQCGVDLFGDVHVGGHWDAELTTLGDQGSGLLDCVG